MKKALKIIGWVLAIAAVFAAAAWAITKLIDKFERQYASIPSEDDGFLPF